MGFLGNDLERYHRKYYGKIMETEKGFGKVITTVDPKAAEAFLDSGTDANGRVWVTQK